MALPLPSRSHCQRPVVPGVPQNKTPCPLQRRRTRRSPLRRQSEPRPAVTVGWPSAAVTSQSAGSDVIAHLTESCLWQRSGLQALCSVAHGAAAAVTQASPLMSSHGLPGLPYLRTVPKAGRACCRKSSRFPQHRAAQDRSQDSERPQAPGAGPRSLTAAG